MPAGSKPKAFGRQCSTFPDLIAAYQYSARVLRLVRGPLRWGHAAGAWLRVLVFV